MKMEIGSSGASALRCRILSTIKIKVPLTKPTGHTEKMLNDSQYNTFISVNHFKSEPKYIISLQRSQNQNYHL